jgi:hypothetical protein
MNKLLIGLLVTFFLTSCAGSKNATHQSDNTYIVVPVQDHYSKSNEDFDKYWYEFNHANDPTYY